MRVSSTNWPATEDLECDATPGAVLLCLEGDCHAAFPELTDDLVPIDSGESLSKGRSAAVWETTGPRVRVLPHDGG